MCFSSLWELENVNCKFYTFKIAFCLYLFSLTFNKSVYLHLKLKTRVKESLFMPFIFSRLECWLFFLYFIQKAAAWSLTKTVKVERVTAVLKTPQRPLHHLKQVFFNPTVCLQISSDLLRLHEAFRALGSFWIRSVFRNKQGNAIFIYWIPPVVQDF